MEYLTLIFDYILNDLGSTVFLPIIIFILGLVVRLKAKDSFTSALLFGVALSGMSLVISYMTASIGPAAESMTETVGRNFSIIDGGWTTLASITWSWRYAFILFPVQIIVNALLFIFKKTKTINVDMWNVWGKIFQTIIIQSITGSIWLGLIVAIIRIIAELIVGDALQPRIEEKTGIPGVTAPHSLMLFGAVVYPVEMLLRKIKFLNQSSFDTEWLRKKIGIFAENHVMGFILGIIFGLMARYNFSEALQLGIISATALHLLPIVTRIFMQAMSPISDAAGEFMRKKLKDDREVYIGLDTPFLMGSSEIWVSALLTVPVTLLWAIILPQNGILPFAGILNLAMAQAVFYVCNGNLLRMLIINFFVGSPLFLLAGTAVAPMISELAIQNGVIEAGTLVSAAALDAPIFVYAFSFIFRIEILAFIAGAYWIFGYIMMIKDLKRSYAK